MGLVRVVTLRHAVALCGQFFDQRLSYIRSPVFPLGPHSFVFSARYFQHASLRDALIEMS